MRYYQPVLSVEEWETGELASFEVYHYLENAKKDYPDHQIAVYEDDDIEEPTFVDVKRTKIRIVQCTDGESPRDWDNLGTIAYKHSGYKLGEEEISDPIDWLSGMVGLDEDQVYNIAEKLGVDYYSDEVKDYLEDKFQEEFIALKLYLYDHSGISLSSRSFVGRAQHARWDSGQVGYIYVDKETVRKEYSWKNITAERKAKILTYLEGEVETYDTYLRGEVYSFLVEDEDTEDVLDSCGGFYGTDWANNGIMDHIMDEIEDKTEEEVLEILEDLEVEYGY